jgi:hypothetical protein
MGETPQPPQRILTRRQAMSLGGAAGAALLFGKLAGGSGRVLEPLGAAGERAQAQTPSCVLSPAKTEGPYFVDERLNRSDIRESQSGMKLTLNLAVLNVDAGCTPVSGAVVDIWHANAGGTYSDVSQNGTVGQKYLRGLQVTNANGLARFVTIYPGWYQGRAVHVHFKVRLFNGSNETYEFTSQLFFDPATTNAVYASGAYAARGAPSTPNSSDGIYGADGSRLIVPLSSDGSGGLAGTFNIGVTGLPAAGTGSGTQNEVDASILSTRFRRTKSGRRILRLKLDVNERVTVNARLARNDRTIVRRRRSAVKKGTRQIDLAIPGRTKGGTARLTVAMKDAAGTLKVRRRTVKVPKR